MRIWVYLLRCADDAYYAGTHRGEDPGVREAEHNAGLGPTAWTYSRRPVVMAWAEECEDPLDGVAFEQQIKRWNRAKKEALIRGDFEGLLLLARRRSRPPGEEPKRKWTRPSE